MKILITGGAGFIGTALTQKLLDRGYFVTILDNLSSQIHGHDFLFEEHPLAKFNDKMRFINGSVLDLNDWKKALPGQDIVIHFAAETGTGQSMYQIKRYTDVNITGTSNMLDLLANGSYQVKKVVVASSRAIYGEGRYHSVSKGYVYPVSRKKEDLAKGIFDVSFEKDYQLQLCPTDEESKIHPSSVYGITKQVQEQLIMTVCPTINIHPVAFRYQNVYGPGQSLKNPYTGIISIFSNLIKQRKAINIFEDGMESRDFIYIDDIVEATILGIENPAANGQVYNVGSGIATSVLEVARFLCEGYGIDVPLNISGDFRIGDIRHNYADITKIKRDLNFSPSISVKEGLKRFVQWVDSQNMKAITYDESILEMKAKGLMK